MLYIVKRIIYINKMYKYFFCMRYNSKDVIKKKKKKKNKKFIFSIFFLFFFFFFFFYFIIEKIFEIEF